MLVSISVLALLILLIAQLFNAATLTATMSGRHLNADQAAHLVFDRMGNDFAGMVKRPDVNYIFCKATAGSAASGSSDAMFFYSEAPGYMDPGATANMAATGSASTMALVGYRINPKSQYYPNTPVIERLGENLTWGGMPATTGTFPGAMVFLTNPVSQASTLAGNWTSTLGSPPYLSQNTEHYQVLNDMVFRMEFCFLLKSGTYVLSGTSAVTGSTGYSNAPTAIPTTIAQPYITANYFNGGTYPGQAWQEPPGNVYGFPPDLAAIVVTIAVLDNTSRKLISTGNLATLAAALPDSLSGGTVQGETGVQARPQLTAQVWQGQLLQSGFAKTAGVPQTALAQVRIYERTFYLNAN
jgi:hypothetical protein